MNEDLTELLIGDEHTHKPNPNPHHLGLCTVPYHSYYLLCPYFTLRLSRYSSYKSTLAEKRLCIICMRHAKFTGRVKLELDAFLEGISKQGCCR